MEALLSTPIYTGNCTGSPEGWEEKNYAYSILLNTSMFDNNDELAMLNKEVRITHYFFLLLIIIHQGASRCDEKCY